MIVASTIPPLAPGIMFAVLAGLFLFLIPFIWIDRLSLRRRPTMRFSVAGSTADLPKSWRQRTVWALPLLRSTGMLLLIFALLRPQSVGQTRDTSEGIAIEMVLDISGSMAETDFIVNGMPVRRIDAAKQVFRDFVLGTGDLPGRPHDLIGMTVFAMYPDVRCPLTLDHGNLISLLRETDIPGWVRGRREWDHPESHFTALGNAIVRATDELRKAGEQAVAGIPGAEAARSKVMVLLTDGYNNPAPELKADSADPVEAARLAAKLGIRIYTVGAVGTPDAGRNRVRGLFGAMTPRTAEVDETTLKAIADVTGGRYFRAENVEGLTTIYREIDQLERRKTGQRVFHDDTGLARRLILAGLAMIVSELMLAYFVYRRSP